MILFKDKINNFLRRVHRARQQQTLSISANANKCLILLLKEPLPMGELIRRYYEEDLNSQQIKTRSGVFKNRVFNEVNPWVRICPQERKFRDNIRNVEEICQDKRYKIVCVDWKKLFDLMKVELVSKLNLRIFNYKLSDELVNFIIKNRGFLFDLESYKPILYVNKKWIKKSVIGFIYMALFYFYHASTIAQKSKLDTQIIKNLRTLFDMHLANYYGWEDALKLNGNVLVNIKERYDKVFGKEEIDLEPFRDLFSFTIAYGITDYRGKHIQIHKVLSEGISFWLELQRIDKSKKLVVEDTYTKKNVEIVPYSLQIVELATHFNAIDKLTELFK